MMTLVLALALSVVLGREVTDRKYSVDKMVRSA
jgi:hypothetical protein